MIEDAPIGAMLPTEIYEPLDQDDPRFRYWLVEPKYDGHRVLIDLRGDAPRALNRKGTPYSKPFPARILGAINGFREYRLRDEYRHHYIIDGEWLPQTGTYYVFDQIDTTNLDRDWANRRDHMGWLRHIEGLELVQTEALGMGNRKGLKLIEVCQDNPLCDGVVYKDVDSIYTPGVRTAQWRKYKFTYDIDAYVTRIGVEGKSNCEVSLHDPTTDTEFSVAKVSTAGKPDLKIGDVVTVRFLKFTGESLREPRITAIRDDKTALECTINQLIPFMPRNA